MKKIITITIFILISVCSYGQADKNRNNDSICVRLDSICEIIDLIKDKLIGIKVKTVEKERYKLYPTQNIYIFLKLDTQTGKIKQIQWNLDNDKEFEVTLNDVDYSYGTSVANFELYPTQNMYQFIMLEKTTGAAYHVQWGLEPLKRWVQIIR